MKRKVTNQVDWSTKAVNTNQSWRPPDWPLEQPMSSKPRIDLDRAIQLLNGLTLMPAPLGGPKPATGDTDEDKSSVTTLPSQPNEGGLE
jgi:hypothetical protein